MLNKEEHLQYKRHLTLEDIGEAGQNKLKAAKVLVVGAGGLGCPILQYLTAAGVGVIGIIDHDSVDQTNLQRQVLYGYNDIGKFKVSCAISKLEQLNKFVKFKSYIERLTKSNAIKIFKSYDIIVDGTDNFNTRYLINDAAVLAEKPVVFGSIFKFEGQVTTYNYKNGPTYRCLYPKASQDTLNCEEAGVLGVLPGIVGLLQANEVVKMICEIGEVLSGKLLVFNALSMSQNIITYDKTVNSHVTYIADVDEDININSSMKSLTFDEYLKHKDNLFVLDVRTEKEHNMFHLSHDYHIPLKELEERFFEIDTKKPILVYCQTGRRSLQAVNILKTLNVKNKLYNLKDGLQQPI
ncbi:sulfur carrier protein adenylyltransferase ThiF [Formosa agariphila KMM 3901]|uniref:Molybdopterin-synthase adenylyltransferase n=1 Tax=Formosa agariphila (strain DSM 15362 / KCTC 12365 / LMG 23005 / KMM 3901 / M-2Alg 35-1) TaxID=1347342 RepID=T2KN09_FORAG|nr:HesA/MoeB/ThiF family protein [Formosa agariphila]CDF79364.1 sulfur carrier protein adenylyltransferase ThiF [Formosa agariphila KMM 3901]